MISKKILITGSFGVGKTSLFNKFVYNRFSDRYLTTIGVKVDKKTVKVDDEEIRMLIWDIAGEISQDKIPLAHFLGTHGIIYVFDLTRPNTFLNLQSDLEYLKAKVPKATIKIVGNKKDLITDEQLAEVAAQLSTPYNIATSAKTGENVEALFMELAQDLLNQ